MIQICPKCHSDNPPNSRVCTTCGLQLDIVDNMSLPDTGTQDAPKKELKRGTTFADRYEVIEELGRGGMGKVYRVEDTKIKEELALKLINPEVASEKKTIERFINELKGAHKISHRNVCRMYHLGEDKGTYYITMEYVPGEDLKSMIRMTRHLSIGTAVSIVKQVCLGLAEAHRLGVVHRDLKPSNIMIDRDGNARIMDFGIARLYSEKGITEAGIMIGTPEYMSPEQVEALDTDSRSDIYSLGVILYEMVTGRLPFVGETSLMTAVKHKTEIPPDPRKLNAQIPIELSQIILKCLEKNKDKRYQSAEDMLADLNTIEKDMTTSEKALPKRKRILYKEKKDRPMKIWRIAAALVAAALIIGLGIVLLTRQKTQVPLERKMLEEAVEIDPGFALAYVRMSYIHSRMYFFGIDRTDERKTLSRIAINTALELQPELPEAQLTLGFYFHIDLAYAMVYYAIQNGTLLNSFAESARIVLENKVRNQPDDPRYQASLGLVYAYLEQKEKTIEEGELASALHPVSKDAGQGPIYLINLAKIYVMVGEFDKALDQLEYLLPIPQAEFLWQLISVPQLRLDPQWDKLRENPRFIQLLEINK